MFGQNVFKGREISRVPGSILSVNLLGDKGKRENM